MESPAQHFGPYAVLDQIGQGGMGAVYRCRHTTGVEVALKVLRAGGGANSHQRERFRREIQALRRLRHEHLLTVLDAGETAQGAPWLVMPLVSGETLQQRLARHGPLPLDEAFDLAFQLSAALAHVHAAGLIHRDLKPENLIRQQVEGLVRWVVTDFGLAKDLEVEESQVLSQTGAVLGTPGYWAPEQAAARENGPYTDVYGLGAVLYAALTGEPPVSGATFWEAVVATEHQAPRPIGGLRSGVPAPFRRLIHRCLEKDPRARFSDGGEVCAALGLLDLSLVPQRRGLRGAALAGVALLVAGASAWALGGTPGPKGPTTLAGSPAAASPRVGSPAAASPDVESPSAASPSLAGPWGVSSPEASPSAPQPTAQAVGDPIARLSALAQSGDLAAQRGLATKLIAGEEVEQDLEAAVRWLEAAAEAGDTIAIGGLARLLVERRGPEFDGLSDERRALAWLEKGARRGSARALRGLGHMHLGGLGGLPVDSAKAAEYYERAGEGGDADGFYSLIGLEAGPTPRVRALVEEIHKLTLSGDSGASYRLYQVCSAKTLRKVVRWSPGQAHAFLATAVRGGSAHAQVELAVLFMRRNPSSADMARALGLLGSAAKSGSREAIGRLSSIYLSGRPGVRADRARGLDLLRRGARLGEPLTMYQYALAIHEGVFPEASAGPVLFWMKAAAAGGEYGASVWLGKAYMQGEGVPVDPVEGARWFRLGAEAGHPDSRYSIAMAHWRGEGVKQDKARALATFVELGKKGHGACNMMLGVLRTQGEVLERDFAKARGHLRAAARAGLTGALPPLAALHIRGLGGPRDLKKARELVEAAEKAGVEAARDVRKELQEALAAER